MSPVTSWTSAWMWRDMGERVAKWWWEQPGMSISRTQGGEETDMEGTKEPVGTEELGETVHSGKMDKVALFKIYGAYHST